MYQLKLYCFSLYISTHLQVASLKDLSFVSAATDTKIKEVIQFNMFNVFFFIKCLLARVMMGGFPLLIPDDPPPKKANGKEK